MRLQLLNADSETTPNVIMYQMKVKEALGKSSFMHSHENK